MKKLIAFVFVSALAVHCVQGAATVNFSAQNFNGFADASGTALPVGDVVEVGFFNASDSTLQQDAGNFTALNNLFTLFGTGHIGDNVSGLAGYFSDSVSASANALSLQGKQIYFWVFNGTNPATASQEGIFYFSGGLNSEWLFKDDTSNPNTSNPDIADLTNSSNSLVAGAHVVVGALGPNSIAPLNAKAFELSPAPEPASAGLALLGGFTLLLARRRKA